MTTDNTIWIGQNGEKYGPYDEASVRQWMAEDKFAPDALAWREGMADWVPLSHFFFAAPGAAPPPAFRSDDHGYGGDSFSAQRERQTEYAETNRVDIPTPPSMHWGLVLLFSILSFGIFAIVWAFIQANWIRRIDPQSNSRLLLIIALACFVIGEPIYLAGIAAQAHGVRGGTMGLGGLILLARWILYLVAYFSMAGSIEKLLDRHGVRPGIGRITLFFFPMFYLQAQLSWLARWKQTGQTSPAASKGSIWALVLVPVVAILAAIAVPAYQSYIVRVQIDEGMRLADGAETAFTAYYHDHHAAPADNAAAGLAPDTSMTGRYVSSVDVSGGKITVVFGNAGANATIRDKMLVLTPRTSGDQITWSCSADSTVPARDLPLACRQ